MAASKLVLVQDRASIAGLATEAPVLPTDGLPVDFNWSASALPRHRANKEPGSRQCWSFSASGAHHLAMGKLELGSLDVLMVKPPAVVAIDVMVAALASKLLTVPEPWMWQSPLSMISSVKDVMVVPL